MRMNWIPACVALLLAGCGDGGTTPSGKPGTPERAYELFQGAWVREDYAGVVAVLDPDLVDKFGGERGVTLLIELHGKAEANQLPAEVIDELHAAVFEGRPPLHTGEWGMASLEVCLAMIRSAAEGKPVALSHQVPAGDEAGG